MTNLTQAAASRCGLPLVTVVGGVEPGVVAAARSSLPSVAVL